MRHRVKLCLSLLTTVFFLSPAAAQEYYRAADGTPMKSVWVSASTSGASESQADSTSLASSATLDSLTSEASLNAGASCDCCTVACDCAKLAKAVSGAYKGVFYDNNFNYLCDPCYQDWHLGESLKRRAIGDDITMDVGGEYRLRFHNEHNIRGRALTGLSDEFVLQRLRLYSNIQFGKRLRFYAEAIDASSSQENLSPRSIEENRFDAINLFAEATVWSDACRQISVRGGRQELIYGSQRLISPLDWGNTRRTFDGVKVMLSGTSWNVDAFWTRPIPMGQHLNHDHEFDSSDSSRQFMGVYASRKSKPGEHLDFYFLRLAEDDALATNEMGTPGNYDSNTFGVRMTGSAYCWLDWEFESAYQFGDYAGDNISAGFVTLGAGHTYKCAPWKPMVWAYYDWASGDSNPNDGDHGTFNQYFPLGHKYLGFMDFVGRQNIQDFNVQAILHPSAKD